MGAQLEQPDLRRKTGGWLPYRVGDGLGIGIAW